MTMPIGFNFRSTSGYITDVAPDVFIQASSAYAASPGYGWDVNPSGIIDQRDRNSGNIARLAGINFMPNSGSVAASFRVDLPAAGTYDIRLAAGDASTGQTIFLELFDNTTSLGVMVNSATTSAGQRFFDATGVERTNSNWAANNVALTKTFASSILRVKMNGTSSGGSSCIAHLSIAQVITTVDYFPGADISAGNWTASGGGALYAAVDEATYSDADYVSSGVNPSADICEIKFAGVLGANSNTSHTISYRIKGDSSCNMTVKLMCGSTTIKTWTHTPAPSSYTQYDQTLTTGEADSITNYSELRLRVQAG